MALPQCYSTYNVCAEACDGAHDALCPCNLSYLIGFSLMVSQIYR